MDAGLKATPGSPHGGSAVDRPAAVHRLSEGASDPEGIDAAVVRKTRDAVLQFNDPLVDLCCSHTQVVRLRR